MRLWSLHPKYLDSKGLVAVWREGLLAYAVLQGRTRGYKHHPQLERFKAHPRPLAAIRMYLHVVCDEADRRGYNFDRKKLGRKTVATKRGVTSGQLCFELKHLKRKLRRRDPRAYRNIRHLRTPECHPLFRTRRGTIESWEKA
ncbi:MAG TPA: pyrimidine dimer DNA glycosylase/endonuclease V [Bacteroidota bacterium]